MRLSKVLKINRPSISRFLFYAIVFLIPLNLGYHFVVKEAYVSGILTDYLIPTVYVQDILIFLLTALNLDSIVKAGATNDVKYVVWFVFAAFLSTVFADPFVSSITAFLRLLLYALLTIYVKSNLNFDKDFKKIVKVLAVSFLFVCLLGFVQWFKQGSVFNNYLFFGEQPYTVSTPGINVENFFGQTKVPPYGTFRHPNILGGLLSIILIWICLYFEKSRFLKAVYVLGFIILFLTLSRSAHLNFIIGTFLLINFKSIRVRYLASLFVMSVFLLSLVMPYIPDSADIFDLKLTPSYYRRADLLESSYKLIKNKPLFGYGYGISTAYTGHELRGGTDIRFSQPPHNVLVLIFLESGLFAVIIFMAFFVRKIKESMKHPVLFVALLQILFLGSFDHYFFTIHQTGILLWIIFGLI